MNVCAALLFALEMEWGVDRKEFINNADEWVYFFGDKVPDYLKQPVEKLDRDTIQALVDHWMADIGKRKKGGLRAPAISGTSSGYTDLIIEEVIPKAIRLGDVTDTLTGAPSSPSKAGDKWVSPGRLALTWEVDLTALTVLLVLAAHGNDQGENIWVSQATVAGYIGRDRTTVYRAVKRLEKAGAITRTAKPRQHRPATYRINRGPRIV